MNDEHSENWPRTQPDFAQIPPLPPKLAAQDLGDDGKQFVISVAFTENHRASDKSMSNRPLAEFCFNPKFGKQEYLEVTSHDGSPLSGFAAYSPDAIGGNGLLSVLVRQKGDLLATLSCMGSYNVQSTAWMSPENNIVISVFQSRK